MQLAQRRTSHEFMGQGAAARFRFTDSGPRPVGEDQQHLIFTRLGHTTWLTDGFIHFLSAGMLLWIGAGQRSILLDASPDTDLWSIVSPQESAWSSTSNMISPYENGCPGPGRTGRIGSEAIDLLVRVLETTAQEPVGSALSIAGLKYATLFALSQAKRVEDSTLCQTAHTGVTTAILAIAASPEASAVPEVALKSGLSISRLSALFKEQTGLSMVEFRSRQRLRRFLALYGEGREQTMAEAAESAGFGSYPQFHRTFKAIMGIGPADYARGRQQAPALRGTLSWSHGQLRADASRG